MRLTNETENTIKIEPGETIRVNTDEDISKGLSKRITKIFIKEVIW